MKGHCQSSEEQNLISFQDSRVMAKSVSHEGEILDLGAKHHLLKLSGS